MTERAPKPPIPEALSRRISDALSSDEGLGSDPELSKLLSSDKGASSYAKDVARINKWLASWPVPEPSDAAMEALATRIEQRLGETLPGAASAFIGAPDFDDDDATRDATAGLIRPAVSAPVARPAAVAAPAASTAAAPAKKGTLVGMPLVGKPGGPVVPAKPAITAPAKPFTVARPGEATKVAGTFAKPEPAKVEAPKVEAPKAEAAKVEPAKVAAAVEPAKVVAPAPEPAPPARITEDLPILSGEIELVASNSIPPEPISIPPEAETSAPIAPAIPKAAATPSPPPAKKKKKKSDPPPAKGAFEDRISIPMPAPLASVPITQMGAPLGNVTQLGAARPPPERESRRLWPMLAAAAVVALGVAGGVSLMQSGSDAPARTTTAIATVAPEAESAPPPVGAAVGGLPADDSVAVAAPAEVAPVAMPATAVATPAPVAMPAAAAEATGGEGALGDMLRESPDGAGGMARAASTEPVTAGRRARVVAPRREDDSRAAPTASTTASSGGAPATGASASGPIGGGAESRSGAGGGGSASRGGAGAAAAPASGGDLPESPDRGVVRDVLEGVRPQVEACFGEEHGLAEVAVIVAGSGRVTTSTVSGRFAGTPVGSCIARAVRGARFPAFSNPRFEVHYQYRY